MQSVLRLFVTLCPGVFLVAETGCGFPIGRGDAAPQAELIAFGECDTAGRSQIAVARTNGENRRQLTHDSGQNWFPAWSPDGTRLMYTHESGNSLQLWIMKADGGDPRPLLQTGISLAASWSPDGHHIAFAHAPAIGEGLRIWLMNLDDGNARQLIPGDVHGLDENVPRWSPDGQRVVFTSNRRGGRYEIWTADARTGGDLRVLTTAWFDAQLGADIEQKVPAWSPDGSRIAYWSGVEATDPRPNLPRAVWVMNADGSDPRRLVDGDDPSWSPDGSTIIHSTAAGGTPALGAVSPDGSRTRILFRVRACRPLQSSWTVTSSRV